MKTILISAYAINPYKGSEDAMGWNMVLQAARFHKAIVVTRKNNKAAIEQFIMEHPDEETLFSNLKFIYFDWPKWLIFWKKGPLLSMIYYYGWQFTLALKLKSENHDVDIVHNLNFHNDWTPSFLWILNKPFVWGHVGHHDKIPKQYLKVYSKKEYVKDRFLWLIKNFFWQLDPFLAMCKNKASVVICMNKSAVDKLKLKHNFIIHPSVASDVEVCINNKQNEVFNILSIGRFVPLKGFDLTIKSFAHFYKNLPQAKRMEVKLTLIGKGPSEKLLRAIADAEGVSEAVNFINWLPMHEVKSYYKNAAVFLFPSHEGAGMVVSEAMSYQLPVICLDNSGPGQFIHPNSGLKVSFANYEKTVETLAAKLNELFFNSELLATEQSLTNERYRELFSWNIRGEMLKSVYEKAYLNLNTRN